MVAVVKTAVFDLNERGAASGSHPTQYKGQKKKICALQGAEKAKYVNNKPEERFAEPISCLAGKEKGIRKKCSLCFPVVVAVCGCGLWLFVIVGESSSPFSLLPHSLHYLEKELFVSMGQDWEVRLNERK